MLNKLFNKLFKKENLSENQNTLTKLNGLSMLLIADTHRRLSDNQLDVLNTYRDSVNVILTLGDIPVESISEIQPNYGVLGNHDYINGIEPSSNLHMVVRELNALGVSIGGFEGSSRYKPGNFIMYSQEESVELLKKLEYCDILITHDSCIKEYYKYHLDDIDAHSGLLGIDNYLEDKKPLLHIHGHHHKNVMEEKYNILSIGVYGMVILRVKEGKVYLEQIN